jgi:dihydroxy-acid dehydratase
VSFKWTRISRSRDANTWNEVVPGHVHLNKLVYEYKRGIVRPWRPLRVRVPSVFDASPWALGMRFSLPSRETSSTASRSWTIRTCIGRMGRLTNCDKVTPGM